MFTMHDWKASALCLNDAIQIKKHVGDMDYTQGRAFEIDEDIYNHYATEFDRIDTGAQSFINYATVDEEDTIKDTKVNADYRYYGFAPYGERYLFLGNITRAEARAWSPDDVKVIIC
jgi:hypothetical protein